MKALFQRSVFVSLTYILGSCTSSQIPETIAQRLIAHYQSGQFDTATQLFLPQKEAYQVAEVVGTPKGFLKADGLEGEAEYQNRLKNGLKTKRNGFKISWKQVKFEKLAIKSTKKYLESLETMEAVIFFKEKVMFQQPIKLVKFKTKLYLWQVGEFDRYRAK